MTRIDIYRYAKDKEIIGNHSWRADYVYVRVGLKFFRLNDLMEINILKESSQNDDDFEICGKISTIAKLKIRIKLVFRLLSQTK